MMTLFMFLLGLATIICISRYNESDKLFWKLFVSFVGAYAAGTIVVNMMDHKEQDKVVTINQTPTQVLESIDYNACSFETISLNAANGEKSPKPVSKDTLLNCNNFSLSEVRASSRGQPYLETYYDDS